MSVTLKLPSSSREVTERHGSDHHWTTEEFYQAAADGKFDDHSKLEIIHGRIIEKMPAGPPHTTIFFDVAENLRDVLRPRYLVREERAIHIAFDREPIPDIAILTGKSADYGKQHPTPEKVVLLVEVADSSADYDTGGKARLYAQAGIADYWVVLENELAIVQHREPTPEGYRDVKRLADKDLISPLAAPEVVWMVSALLESKE